MPREDHPSHFRFSTVVVFIFPAHVFMFLASLQMVSSDSTGQKGEPGGCIRERCREEKVGEEEGAGVSFLGCLRLPYLSWTCHSRRVPTEMMSLKRRGSASWSRGRGVGVV